MSLKFKKIFRIIWFLIAVIATVFTVTDHAVIFHGDGSPSTLFFTSWSVWFAFLAALIFMVFNPANEKVKICLNVVKFTADIMMIATFVVSAFVLPDKIWTAGYWNPGSIFKHFLLPILTIADAIMFDERGSYKVWFPFASVVASLVYWTSLIVRFVNFRNANGGSIPAELHHMYYPYGFTNLDAGHTLAGLIRLLIIIGVSLVTIGYVFVICKRQKKNA